MADGEDNGEFYLRYYVGHKGKFGHEFLEFEFRPDGKLRYANNSNYKNDTMIRKEVFLTPAVLRECRRIVNDSEIMKEDDNNWPEPDRVGRQELEIVMGNEHISFTTSKIGSLMDVQTSKDPEGLRIFYYLVQIKQDDGEVFICQKKYAKEILKKFHVEECKETTTPMCQKESLSKEDGSEKVEEGYFRSMIGSMMYLTATRPDILFSVSILSRFMHCSSEVHLKAAKRVLRYIKGTVNFGVKFKKCQNFKLIGFSDSDWGGSKDDMKSTSGYCFNLGSSVFSWCCKKQETVAQSTAEAEFVAATAAVNQALWLRKLLTDLHMKQPNGTEVFVDNQAAIAISHNPVFHGKTKHFKIKLFFLREVQKEGDVNLVYCKSEDQLADTFTKPLPANKFELIRQRLGVCSS